MRNPHKVCSSQNPGFEHQRRELMKSPSLSFGQSGLSPYDNDPDRDALLERYNFAYILAQVKRIVRFHMEAAHPAIVDLELEDIAQEVHIRFWQKLRTTHIEKPDAYIRQMINHAFADVMRRKQLRGTVQLPTTSDGELFEGGMLGKAGESISNLEAEFEEKQAVTLRTEKVATAISTLPPRQKNAIECSLYERWDDFQQFKDTFKLHGVNIEGAQWPAGNVEKHLLKASISAARRSIARCMNVDLALYKQKGASYFSSCMR
jgi:RNA polymerase sigma factor (sigma-70 family)